MLNEIAASLPFFGIFLTALVYLGALKLQQKTKSALLNPLIISGAVIIIFLLITKIDYRIFIYGKPLEGGRYDGTGAAFFQTMLTPTTVCLAIPLYEKIAYLKKYPLAIIGGILSGALTSVACVLAIGLIFGITQDQYITLLPKSITTAIGVAMAEELGGIPSVTAAVIAFTGVMGNTCAALVMKLFKIKHPVAVGLACGTSAHAIGTSRAREFGEIEEAMSGLSIAVCGLITVVLMSFFAMIPMQ
ncbi:MAG: LrgB family protein [Clostridia bacterium]|nr:LrgB family protein [Clostridia bacterium]